MGMFAVTLLGLLCLASLQVAALITVWEYGVARGCRRSSLLVGDVAAAHMEALAGLQAVSAAEDIRTAQSEALAALLRLSHVRMTAEEISTQFDVPLDVVDAALLRDIDLA